jgi:hypothetical protein
MAEEKAADARVFRIVQTPRTKRTELPRWLRHLIVAALGAAVALLSFYILRKMGY